MPHTFKLQGILLAVNHRNLIKACQLAENNLSRGNTHIDYDTNYFVVCQREEKSMKSDFTKTPSLPSVGNFALLGLHTLGPAVALVELARYVVARPVAEVVPEPRTHTPGAAQGLGTVPGVKVTCSDVAGRVAHTVPQPMPGTAGVTPSQR
jgi:hypothetical protein